MPAHTAAVSLDNVSKAYGRVKALDGLSFSVAEGRFFALFGPSSVGKTTTLRTISGLVIPDQGTVALHGVDATQAPIKSRGVSMVFQSFALYPHLTVFENLAYPLREAKVARPDIDKRVKETAEMLKLAHRLERKPNTLSGGEQQRVALGRSLIARPKILLLDEPLTNLDAKLRHDMRAELKRLHRQFGMTIIYATPDELEALSMGEEIAVMRDGHVVQIGSADELYERPRDVYVAAKIGAPHMNLIEAKVSESGEALDTLFGRFDLKRKIAARAGDKVMMGVRPSDLEVASAAQANLAAPVQLLEPLGDVTIVSLGEKSDNLRILLPESRASEIRLGERLPIRVEPHKIHVFSHGDGIALR